MVDSKKTVNKLIRMKKKILNHTPNKAVYVEAIESGLSELQARIIANRSDSSCLDKALVRPSLNVIAPPWQLADCVKAAKRLAQAIKEQQSIGILTDYDVDGITSHAVIYYALTNFFNVDKNLITSYIGHRIDDGYGISQGLVSKILANLDLPDVIITADCGSSDEERIKLLKQAEIDLIVTDHHAIPTTGIPSSAFAVVNPTREDCSYPDASIAGCMVSWLVMSQLRIELIDLGLIPTDSPKLSSLLDFVSLGTVADAVSLYSVINRAVVLSGLQIMNGLDRFSWQAMLQLLNKSAFKVDDLGFQIGPRINARSRMSDPYQALVFLTAKDLAQASSSLGVLDQDNIQRRETEKGMLINARALAEQYLKKFAKTLVVYGDDFHPGVQGIVASRLVEDYGRPTIVFSPSSDPQVLTASARTINLVNIRNILQKMADSNDKILISFGGHKGAAGLKIKKENLSLFQTTFEKTVEMELSQDMQLYPTILTDGTLTSAQFSYDSIEQFELLQPYGRGFEAPCFNNVFEVHNLRQVGNEGQHTSFIICPLS